MFFQEIKNRVILNPFFWFSFVWTFILVLQVNNFTTIYPSLSTSLLLFFLLVIATSVVLAFVYDRCFLKNRRLVLITNDKPSLLWLLCCVFGFLTEAVYSGMIPFLEVLNGNTESYSNFGIPHITFLIVSATIAFSAVSSVKLVYGKEHRIQNLLCLLTCYLIFALSYSRGILILCFLITLVTLLSKLRFTWVSFLSFLGIAILGSFLFNIAGNIRSHASWNDSSFLMGISGFNPKYSFLKDFSWVIVYAESPLGNLSYNVANGLTQQNLSGLFSQLLPDFIGKRLYPQYDSSLFLIQPGLTVSSMFAGGFKYYGLLGMGLSYLELVLVVFLVSWATKKITLFFLASTASLSIICAMTFFDNMITYSGYSFFLFFLILGRVIEKKDDYAYLLEYLKIYLSSSPEIVESL